MSRRIPFAAVCCLIAGVASAQDTKPTKLTVMIRGVASDQDAEALRGAFKKLDGIKFDADAIQRGEKGKRAHYFSPPFTIEISDLSKADLGDLSKLVAETKTPSRGETPPSLNLIVYHPAGRIDEPDVVAFRAAVSDVNGTEAIQPGGVGGNVAEGWMWLRLDGTGAARLSLIQMALKKADLDLRLEKP